jgi:hypothetical protein
MESTIPQEVLLGILYMLPVRDILSLGMTDHFWLNLSKDDALWRFLYSRDFPNAPPPVIKRKPLGRQKKISSAVQQYIDQSRVWRLVIYDKVYQTWNGIERLSSQEKIRLYSPYEPKESYVITKRTCHNSGPGYGRALPDLYPSCVLYFNIAKFLTNQTTLFRFMKFERYWVVDNVTAVGLVKSATRQTLERNFHNSGEILLTKDAVRKKIKAVPFLESYPVIVKGDANIHAKFQKVMAQERKKKLKKDGKRKVAKPHRKT